MNDFGECYAYMKGGLNAHSMFLLIYMYMYPTLSNLTHKACITILFNVYLNLKHMNSIGICKTISKRSFEISKNIQSIKVFYV